MEMRGRMRKTESCYNNPLKVYVFMYMFVRREPEFRYQFLRFRTGNS
jgi:hypothetical protein